LAKAWRQETWWKARGTAVLICGTGKEIVVGDHGAYPEKFGRWRAFLNRIVVGSFGIQAESYSVWLVEIQLSCGRIATRV
jgi:hypothetical protein